MITRTIDARRELVFEAFTDVAHLARWWGPNGFTTTTISWREIAPPERIALIHGESAQDPDAFESIITFADHGEATEITMRAVFPTAALRDRAVEQYHAVEGGRQTLNSLAAYITEQERPDR